LFPYHFGLPSRACNDDVSPTLGDLISTLWKISRECLCQRPRPAAPRLVAVIYCWQSEGGGGFLAVCVCERSNLRQTTTHTQTLSVRNQFHTSLDHQTYKQATKKTLPFLWLWLFLSRRQIEIIFAADEYERETERERRTGDFSSHSSSCFLSYLPTIQLPN
jgi:hypothetical protein